MQFELDNNATLQEYILRISNTNGQQINVRFKYDQMLSGGDFIAIEEGHAIEDIRNDYEHRLSLKDFALVEEQSKSGSLSHAVDIIAKAVKNLLVEKGE